MTSTASMTISIDALPFIPSSIPRYLLALVCGSFFGPPYATHVTFTDSHVFVTVSKSLVSPDYAAALQSHLGSFGCMLRSSSVVRCPPPNGMTVDETMRVTLFIESHGSGAPASHIDRASCYAPLLDPPTPRGNQGGFAVTGMAGSLLTLASALVRPEWAKEKWTPCRTLPNVPEEHVRWSFTLELPAPALAPTPGLAPAPGLAPTPGLAPGLGLGPATPASWSLGPANPSPWEPSFSLDNGVMGGGGAGDRYEHSTPFNNPSPWSGSALPVSGSLMWPSYTPPARNVYGLFIHLINDLPVYACLSSATVTYLSTYVASHQLPNATHAKKVGEQVVGHLMNESCCVVVTNVDSNVLHMMGLGTLMSCHQVILSSQVPFSCMPLTNVLPEIQRQGPTISQRLVHDYSTTGTNSAPPTMSNNTLSNSEMGSLYPSTMFESFGASSVTDIDALPRSRSTTPTPTSSNNDFLQLVNFPISISRRRLTSALRTALSDPHLCVIIGYLPDNNVSFAVKTTSTHSTSDITPALTDWSFVRTEYPNTSAQASASARIGLDEVLTAPWSVQSISPDAYNTIKTRPYHQPAPDDTRTTAHVSPALTALALAWLAALDGDIRGVSNRADLVRMAVSLNNNEINSNNSQQITEIDQDLYNELNSIELSKLLEFSFGVLTITEMSNHFEAAYGRFSLRRGILDYNYRIIAKNEADPIAPSAHAVVPAVVNFLSATIRTHNGTKYPLASSLVVMSEQTQKIMTQWLADLPNLTNPVTPSIKLAVGTPITPDTFQTFAGNAVSPSANFGPVFSARAVSTEVCPYHANNMFEGDCALKDLSELCVSLRLRKQIYRSVVTNLPRK